MQVDGIEGALGGANATTDAAVLIDDRCAATQASGRLAYVYDEKGHFDLSCNPDGIDLESIEPGSEAENELKTLIEEHRKETGSTKAAAMLADWERYRAKFVRIFPVEYRNALKIKGNC